MTYHTRNHPIVADREKGNIILSVAIIFGLFFVSVLYLAQVNSVVAKNFELRSAQNSLKDKQGQNQRLLVALMRTRSLGNLESAAKNLNLVAVEKIDYLKVAPEFFALSQNP